MLNPAVRKISRYGVRLSMLVAICLCLVLPCDRADAQFSFNSNADNDFSPVTLNQKYDFVITVRTQKLQNYMSYQGSTLFPIVNLKVYFRNTGRAGHANAMGTDSLYEELWFRNQTPIGCRRYNQLNLNLGEMGCIWFDPQGDPADAQTCAADAIARLFVDIANGKSTLSTTYLPAQIFNQTITNFAQLGFYPYQQKVEQGVNTTMILHLTTQPAGQDESVYYKPM